MLRIVTAVLLLSSFAITAEKPKEWKTGKLISFNQHGWTSRGGSTTTGSVNPDGTFNASTNTASWNHVTFYAVVDAGELTYFAERTLSWRWQRSPRMTENTEVKWRIEKDNLFLVDDAGKEFKMSIVKRRKNDTARASTSAKE
jgi:hypothetical protein